MVERVRVRSWTYLGCSRTLERAGRVATDRADETDVRRKCDV